MFLAKRTLRAEGKVYEKGQKYKSVPKDVAYFFEVVKEEEETPKKTSSKKKQEKKPDVRTR